MRMVSRIACAALLLAGGCSSPTPPRETPEEAEAPLPSAAWAGAVNAETFAAWRKSCAQIVKKPDTAMIGAGRYASPARLWKPACRESLALAQADDETARRFFAGRFRALQAENAFLTGYFTPEIKGSRVKTAKAQVPIYGRPTYLKDGMPYFTRGQIEDGMLRNKGLEVAWAEDAGELFFLQVQGSGTLVTPQGERIKLVFAGKNNQPYVSIGKVLIERGELKKGAASLPAIKQWMREHPAQASALMRENPAYVFFKESKEDGFKGAAGVTLTPEASLAVDPAFIPYGMPLFVEAEQRMPAFRTASVMIAQDAGTAIKGAGRGDMFFGGGERAEKLAGGLQAKGTWTPLVPREVAEHEGR